MAIPIFTIIQSGWSTTVTHLIRDQYKTTLLSSAILNLNRRINPKVMQLYKLHALEPITAGGASRVEIIRLTVPRQHRCHMLWIAINIILPHKGKPTI